MSVFLFSTYDAADLPRDAAASGASGYVNKERFGAGALQQLWQQRHSGQFISAAGSSRERDHPADRGPVTRT